MKTRHPSLCFVLLGFVALMAGCQQKMAQNPYFRPYEKTDFFPDGRSARPLEPGTVHRAQKFEDDPLNSGLSEKGRTPRPQPKDPAPGAEPIPLAGTPSDPANFVSEFPFPLTEKDLRRGMERFSIFCIECHGPLGNGSGKIVERGFLRPPSFHTVAVEKDEPGETGNLPRGHSRGFYRFINEHNGGKPIALKDVPVGYIFEVISKGFGGMPDYAVIPPADRWRIAAYVRTLQLSQSVTAAQLTAEDRKALEEKKK